MICIFTCVSSHFLTIGLNSSEIILKHIFVSMTCNSHANLQIPSAQHPFLYAYVNTDSKIICHRYYHRVTLFMSGVLLSRAVSGMSVHLSKFDVTRPPFSCKVLKTSVSAPHMSINFIDIHQSIPSENILSPPPPPPRVGHFFHIVKSLSPGQQDFAKRTWTKTPPPGKIFYLF